jgi:hypothetical protein
VCPSTANLSGSQASDNTSKESVSLEDYTGHDTRKMVGKEIPDGCVRTHPVTQNCINAPHGNAQHDKDGSEALYPVFFSSF